MVSAAQPLEAELLVIGLGPGGASAALAAAERGCRVLAIESRRRIGEPVQCAEFIPLPLLPSAVETARGQRIAAMQTHLPSGQLERSELPGLMIDRAAFDRGIAARAQQAGATLWSGSRLTQLEAARSLATIHRAGESITLRYRALIAADGPRSTVAAALGLAPLERVEARQIRVPLRRRDDAMEIWLGPEYPGGYGWCFPNGAIANLGVGAWRLERGRRRSPARSAERGGDEAAGRQRGLKPALEALHQQLIAQGRVGAQPLARSGGQIPVGGLRERLVVSTTLFVGDAAGLTHPISGAGIASAVLSGQAAGAAAAHYLAGDHEALAEYEEEMRDQFSPSLERALRRRRELTPIWAESREDAPHRRAWIAFPEYLSRD